MQDAPTCVNVVHDDGAAPAGPTSGTGDRAPLSEDTMAHPTPPRSTTQGARTPQPHPLLALIIGIVHLLIGGLGIAMSRRADSARTFGWLLFVVYGLTFVYGLIAVNNDGINFL